MWANLWDHLEIVKLLKNVNYKNFALIEASKEGHLKVVKALNHSRSRCELSR